MGHTWQCSRSIPDSLLRGHSWWYLGDHLGFWGIIEVSHMLSKLSLSGWPLPALFLTPHNSF